MNRKLTLITIGLAASLTGMSVSATAGGRSNHAPSRSTTAQSDEHTGTTGGGLPVRPTYGTGGTGASGTGLDANKSEGAGMGSNAATDDVTGELNEGRKAGGSGSSAGTAELGGSRPAPVVPGGAGYMRDGKPGSTAPR